MAIFNSKLLAYQRVKYLTQLDLHWSKHRHLGCRFQGNITNELKQPFFCSNGVFWWDDKQILCLGWRLKFDTTGASRYRKVFEMQKLSKLWGASTNAELAVEMTMKWENPCTARWVNQWIKESTNQWTSGSMNQQTNKSMNQWSTKSMNQWRNDSTTQWINKTANQQINESLN